MATADLQNIKALAFDVFGTTVDYRSTIAAEGARLNAAKGLDVDWGQFAVAWRRKYRPNLQRVARGELPWMKLDALHRLALDETLDEFGVRELDEAERAELNLIWHRLQPWPDTLAGLARLRTRYILTTLSNGNMSLLVEMAKRAGLPWDCVLSAELVKAYKPDPKTYQMVPDLLSLEPQQVMLVAAHPDDLRAAQAQGLRTAYVSRPGESDEDVPHAEFDIVADDFADLAAQLGT